jgi:hypothetical protein
MKTIYSLALLVTALVPASADVLYSNGPFNGTIGGFAINSDQAISDSFVLTSASTVTGVDFGAITAPGDSITSLQWSIGTAPGDGSLGTGTSPTTDAFLFTNSFDFRVESDSFSTGSISLGAATYYLTLQNAVSAPSNNGPAWVLNNGPSLAFYSCLVCGGGDYRSLAPGDGGSGSEGFDIQGTIGTSSGSVTPEPGSYAALILGFAGVTLVVRSRRAKQRAA